MKPYVSTNLKRHGDSQTVVQVAFLGMAVAYYVAAKQTTEPLMPANVYGEWVVSFPAEWWAISLMFASALFLAGIRINGHWRWSPALRFAGAGWHFITLTAFCVGASGAADGDFFMLSTGTFAIVHFVFLWWNARDLAAAIGRGHE